MVTLSVMATVRFKGRDNLRVCMRFSLRARFRIRVRFGAKAMLL